MRQILMLDLKADPELIAEYEAHHRHIWPSVTQNMRKHGVLEMEIYRLGTRLVMNLETDDKRFNSDAFAESHRSNPDVAAWENLMEQFQQPTPFSVDGVKWTPMHRIFKLTEAI